MLTLIVRRTDEPNVVQLTQELLMQELSLMSNCEMLLEDSWAEGLQKVRTPFVCLVEPDCILSASYLLTNLGIFGRNIKGQEGRGKGGGGYTKLAMLASSISLNNFNNNRIYGYSTDNGLHPERRAPSSESYHIQIAHVPGAIIRYSSIKDVINKIDWDDSNLVRLATDLSLYLWDTGRRIKVNPLAEYVSTSHLDEFEPFDIPITAQVQRLFDRNFDILNNPKVRP